jgi:hypothetical protein
MSEKRRSELAGRLRLSREANAAKADNGLPAPAAAKSEVQRGSAPDVAGSQSQQVTEFLDLLLIRVGFRAEFDSVVVSAAVADNARRPNRSA